MSVYCEKCGHKNTDSAKFCQGCGDPVVLLTDYGILKAGVILDKRYEVKRLIRAGGMGAEYEAMDHRFENRICAVKEMLNQAKGPEDEQYIIDRFKKEAFILRSLRHKHLPVVTDYLIENGRYYLVMDYIEGKDLDIMIGNFIKGDSTENPEAEDIEVKVNEGIPEDTVIEWAKEILEALEYLHTLTPPIVYRDLKPANIMLRSSDHKVVLVDFGIARPVTAGSDSTKTIVGTPAFSPKELFEGKPEPRSDIYSLGATMHCLLTGIIPVIPCAFRPVREHNPKISEELAEIVMKALSISPKKRYESAGDMREALEKLRPTRKTDSLNLEKETTSEEGEGLSSQAIQSYKPEKAEQNLSQAKFSFSLFSFVKTATGKVLLISLSALILISVLLFIIFSDKNKISSSSEGPRMVLIQGGTFDMGKIDSGSKEVVHSVTISSFYMNRYEVTNSEYCAFLNSMGNQTEGGSIWINVDGKECGITKWSTSGTFKVKDGYENKPVIYVTWFGAVAYCNWLSEKDRLSQCYGQKDKRGNCDIKKNGYRLPTEAEWEYACCGEDLTYDKINNMAWYRYNSGNNTHDAGQKSPNKFGLYDMRGNVWEWCNDWYGDYSPEPVTDPGGTSYGAYRIGRGGSFMTGEESLYRQKRSTFDPLKGYPDVGFRIVRTP